MQGQIHTELGSILIDADVVATYAGSVALGCSGIVGMASLDMRDGLMKLLKKVLVFTPPPVEPEDAPINMRIIMTNNPALESAPKEQVEKPAVLADIL